MSRRWICKSKASLRRKTRKACRRCCRSKSRVTDSLWTFRRERRARELCFHPLKIAEDVGSRRCSVLLLAIQILSRSLKVQTFVAQMNILQFLSIREQNLSESTRPTIQKVCLGPTASFLNDSRRKSPRGLCMLCNQLILLLWTKPKVCKRIHKNRWMTFSWRSPRTSGPS